MPTWLKIASALIFIVLMIAWKFVVKAGVTAFDWWFTIPVLFVVFGLAHLIDRSDAKKRQQKSSGTSDPKLDMPSKDIPDYYNALGVSRDADRVVIQAAYRALAKKYHPDTTKEDPTQAQIRFAEISAAYSALSSVIHTDKEEIARSPPTEPTRRTAARKSVQQNGDLIFWVPVLFIVVALAVIGYFASKPPSQSATSYSPSELSEMVQQSLRELKKTNH